MFKWLVMAYVFLFLVIEDLYFSIRCIADKPVVWKDWPDEGKCKHCGKIHGSDNGI